LISGGDYLNQPGLLQWRDSQTRLAPARIGRIATVVMQENMRCNSAAQGITLIRQVFDTKGSLTPIWIRVLAIFCVTIA
jgi:hypothetical protein